MPIVQKSPLPFPRTSLREVAAPAGAAKVEAAPTGKPLLDAFEPVAERPAATERFAAVRALAQRLVRDINDAKEAGWQGWTRGGELRKSVADAPVAELADLLIELSKAPPTEGRGAAQLSLVEGLKSTSGLDDARLDALAVAMASEPAMLSNFTRRLLPREPGVSASSFARVASYVQEHSRDPAATVKAGLRMARATTPEALTLLREVVAGLEGPGAAACLRSALMYDVPCPAENAVWEALHASSDPALALVVPGALLASESELPQHIPALRALPREALHGTSRAMIELAGALAERSRISRAQDVLRASTLATQANVLRDLSAEAAVDSEIASVLRAPAAGSLDDGQPLDTLCAALAPLAGIGGVLAAAHDAIPRRERAEAPQHALLRARPELYGPLLFDRMRRATSSSISNDALAQGAALVDGFRARMPKADASSGSTKLRVGSVTAGALALTLLDVALTRGGSVARRPLDAGPALVELLGRAKIAKNGPERNAMLSSLFELAASVARMPEPNDDVGAKVHALLGTLGATTTTPATFTAAANALSAELAAAYPINSDVAKRLTAFVDGRRGGPGLLRYVEGIASAFTRGVEAESLLRIVTALQSGALPQLRRESLVASRFKSDDDEQKLSSVFAAFSEGATASAQSLLGAAGLPDLEGVAKWTLHDSDDVLDWCRAVDDIASCQRTNGTPEQNRGLLNRFEDGSVRLIALRDESGKTLARAAMRLVVVDDADDKGHLTLLVDHLYESLPPQGVSYAVMPALISAFAAERAQALGIPYGLAFRGERRVTVTVPAPRSTDYLDLGRRGVIRPMGGDLRTTDRVEVHGMSLPAETVRWRAPRTFVDDGAQAMPLAPRAWARPPDEEGVMAQLAELGDFGAFVAEARAPRQLATRVLRAATTLPPAAEARQAMTSGALMIARAPLALAAGVLVSPVLAAAGAYYATREELAAGSPWVVPLALPRGAGVGGALALGGGAAFAAYSATLGTWSLGAGMVSGARSLAGW